MINKIENVIGYLNSWREAYMHDVEPSEYLKAGVEYLNDSLSGIYSEKPKTQCLASHLFSELTAADKISILEQIDFDVDFDALEARYYLDKIVK